jgi:ATP-dependent DNA helicase RecG
MSITRVKHILAAGEGIRVEFKKSQSNLPSSLFESICAMLNREGGDIILGAADDGSIVGIHPEKIETIKTNLVNLSNNTQKLNPTFILFPTVYELEEGVIMHIQVPSSSQMHKSANKVYDRSNDGDFEVSDPQQIAQIYNNKRNFYSEGTIYSEVTFSDFISELFEKARNLIKSNNANHPWLALSDIEMLKKASLWRKDYQSGKEGFTLGAILLFGKDELIKQILPHYKTDALLRVDNTERYDDRLYVETNLIDAYDALMHFIAKHLPDKFYTLSGQRKSLRTDIFREVVANLIVHREFTNAYPAKLVIYNDRVETENANNAHGSGALSLQDFSPFPKNPSIAKFFIQMGRVDELGSGIINVNKFIKEYSGQENPEFIEGEIFKMLIPIPQLQKDVTVDLSVVKIFNDLIEISHTQISNPVKERWIRILVRINELNSVKAVELQQDFKKSERTILEDLKKLSDYVEYEGSKKTGGYKLRNNVKELIQDKVAK